MKNEKIVKFVGRLQVEQNANAKRRIVINKKNGEQVLPVQESEGIEAKECIVVEPIEAEVTELEEKNFLIADGGIIGEKEEERTASSATYRRNNRTARKVVSGIPEFYQDERNGRLKKIKNKLKDDGDYIINEQSQYKLKFHKRHPQGKIYEVQKNSHTVTLYAEDFARNVGSGRCDLCAEDNSVLFQNESGVEIQYIAYNDRLKENIIIKEVQEKYEYKFKLNIGELKIEESANGELLLKNESGVTEFIIPAPYMYDASGVKSTEVNYEVEIEGENLNIYVRADSSFINAEERTFPVIIDPQIKIVGSDSGVMEYVSTFCDYDSAADNEIFENTLEVSDSSKGSTYEWAEIFIHKDKIAQGLFNIQKVSIQLTASSGWGYFILAGKQYVVQVGETYTVDITDLYKQGGDTVVVGLNATYEPREGVTNSHAEFYVTGDKCPKLIIDYLDFEYTDDIKPTIKKFKLGDKATGHVEMKNGVLTSLFTSFEADDFVLPLSITHLHRVGNSYGDDLTEFYGMNWRLNINKKLRRSGADTDNSTIYTYLDENGDYYIFEEKYYYLVDGKKEFVDKKNVTVSVDGSLIYNGNQVYKHHFCNGYTLISEIDDFKGSDVIEQRQNEEIQLEDYLDNAEKAFAKYLVCYQSGYVERYMTGSSVEELEELIKIKEAIGSNCYLCTTEDLLQLKGIYENIQASFGDTREYYENQQKVYLSNLESNFDFVKKAIKQYKVKKAEYDRLLRQKPVNFIQDKNGVINVFNKDGYLIALYDAYENHIMIEYDDTYRVINVYDSENKALSFVYDKGLLQSITDNHGRTVSYGYTDKKLTQVTFADGSIIVLEYSSDRMRTITSGDRVKAKINHKNNKIDSIVNSRQKVNYNKNLSSATGSDKTVSSVGFTYEGNKTTLSYDDGRSEAFKFNDDSKIILHEEKDECNRSTSTAYTYQGSDGKEIEVTTTSNVEPSVSGKIIEDKFNLITYKDSGWKNISSGTSIREVSNYTYDLNNRLVKEVTEEHTKINGVDKVKTRVTSYGYNGEGKLIFTESCVKGEELTTGKTVEQYVYDEKGDCIKTIKYNTLDSSSKFYTESTFSEKGQVLSESDETGETSTEYEYVDGTKIVNSVKFANGSKLAYGRNGLDKKVSSITQSTESGESNTTDILYVCNMPVEVKSGNTVIDYTYDYKGRKTLVEINGSKITDYTYTEYKNSEDTVDYGTTTQNIYVGPSSKVTIKTTKMGELDSALQTYVVTETTTIDGAVAFSRHANAKGLVDAVTRYVLGSSTYYKTAYTYDEYKNLTQAVTSKGSTAETTESYTYDEYGSVSQRALSGSVSQTYTFNYKTNAAHDLESVSVSGHTFKLETDKYGRNISKEILNGTTKIAGEYITFRKVGDHATNMPSTVFYANGANLKDNIKYKYDECGNIIEIHENGNLKVRYAYDSLNRLIREDNKKFFKTYLYDYDHNGNILCRRETDFTLKSQIEEIEFEEYVYEFAGDKLMSYNGESFAYNNLGSPTTYRGKALTWKYGKFLENYNGTTKFTYDGAGRRISKGSTTYTYDSNGRLIKSSNGLEFIYDAKGVAGVKYGGIQYFYRKDAQGNIIAILDNTGSAVVYYEYDAWGAHAVTDASGKNVTTGIGALNPFRYRGYFYDTETGLYYLKSRYYDPEIGRFISQDSIEYANPKTVNGLNLYAYCLNNPVMGVDPNGSWVISFAFLLSFTVNAALETKILLNDERYKAENVVTRDKNGQINGVEVKNSFLFLNPIAHLIYSSYLYHNVKNDDGTNFFTGDVYDIVGEWQFHNIAAYGSSLAMMIVAPIDYFASGKLINRLYGYFMSGVDLNAGNSLAAESRKEVRIGSEIFKWLSKVFSLNILNW